MTRSLPPRIARLEELAYNLWWSWHGEARELLEAVDPTLWETTEHNPVRTLHELSGERLQRLAEDPSFLKRYDGVLRTYDEEITAGDGWCAKAHPVLAKRLVAYFSAEFGLHSSLPIYSGGLGVLAGDHCKEASDLGVPIVGIGLMYPRGYFHQRIAITGWQETTIEVIDWSHAPIRPVTAANGERLVISVEFAARSVRVAAYEVRLGRVRLLLLDSDLEVNDPWDRQISAQLYGGDQRTRIAQEILLGVGGVRLLRALGLAPSVWHANEGHAAFMMLERVREKAAGGVPFDEAVEHIRATSVFTTHTPVPAGHDAFPLSLVEDSLRGYWGDLEPVRARFFSLGEHDEPWGKGFNMTVFALRLAAHRNAVSQLHGKVSRRMWKPLWPDRNEEQVPIISVTNGVHLPTWVGAELRDLYRRFLGPDWLKQHDEASLWERLSEIPEEELWRIHLRQKRAFVSLLCERARQRWIRELMEPAQLVAAGTLLDPEALTIGFARRFATYKRGTLLFRNVARLLEMLDDSWRPLQIVFAGKAHPADDPGKRLIQEIYAKALDRRFGGRIAFVSDYDLHVSKAMVAGVDVWLNNPRPPMEACGTSGQKAALNGVPHLSVLDGWWYEGYRGGNGWAIGPERDRALDGDDSVDAEDLYRILSTEVIPLYYARDSDNVPRGWVDLMKEAIRSVTINFSARRMVKEYVEKLYVPALSGDRRS
ncbi:MAG: alpha-glucan family phosphorylase [Candidatus Binatia bacterium]